MWALPGMEVGAEPGGCVELESQSLLDIHSLYCTISRASDKHKQTTTTNINDCPSTHQKGDPKNFVCMPLTYYIQYSKSPWGQIDSIHSNDSNLVITFQKIKNKKRKPSP